MAELEQRIISGQPAVLRALLDILEADPETAVTSVHRNDQAEPDRLVVTIAPARADHIGQAFATMITVERNDLIPGPVVPGPDPGQPLPRSDQHIGAADTPNSNQ